MTPPAARIDALLANHRDDHTDPRTELEAWIR